MKQICIGISDFKKLIDQNFYYIDKTLLVKDIMEKGGEVTLIPRPRRFGKTINLSMLKYFFEKTEESNAYLFEDKKIWQIEQYRALQGKYPVIFISFKNAKANTWDGAYDHITSLISKEFDRLGHMLRPILTVRQQEEYNALVSKTATEVQYGASLKFLTELLHAYHHQKVIVLIDEYDAPVYEAHMHGFYEKMLDFLKALLGSVLKDNVHLERGVLTGILMVAKAGIFSDLNNLNVFTMTNSYLAEHFGFTEAEMSALIEYYGLCEHSKTISEWYDGYRCGDVLGLYNPWSALNCVFYKGKLQTYWVNTSANLLIRNLIAQASAATKQELENILQEKPIQKEILESITLPDIQKNSECMWSLLLYAGYLTYTDAQQIQTRWEYTLALPNLEMRDLYERLIREIMTQLISIGSLNELLHALTLGNSEELQIILEHFLLNAISMYDVSSSTPEVAYHMFVLGLLVMLHDRYSIKSNRESGLGRYDIMMIPRGDYAKKKPGIIIEFKKVYGGESLDEAARKALIQIQEKQYARELQALGITDIIAYGIAFKGKEVLVLVA